MRFNQKTTIEKEIKYLQVNAGVRYWEDADVNGISDTEGDNIPCKDGERWKPLIDINTGQITNWEKGKTADTHYKICDDGIYILLEEDMSEVARIEDYVPDGLDIGENGYGDYIIMNIDENGLIQDWDGAKIIESFEVRQAERD